MAGGFQSDDDVISGINVTPLVDVVLVLLIIFLITAPVLYQSAIKVKLPSAKTGEEAEKSPLEFSISKEGELSLGKEKLDWAQLGARASQPWAPAPPNKPRSSARTRPLLTERSIRLMDALRQAGITRFALNVESPPPAK